MKGWIGKIFVTLLGLALLVYSATRSIDFISMTLPEDRQVLAWFGLAALDGGLIVWLLSFLYGSHGGAQRGISIVMVVVDLLGAVAMFTADTVVNTGQAGLTAAIDPSQMMTFVLALSIIIALNIAAGVAHHICDPAALSKMQDEEAQAKIEDKAREQVEKDSDNLAAELAPVYAQSWVARARARAYASMQAADALGLSAAVPQMIDLPARPSLAGAGTVDHRSWWDKVRGKPAPSPAQAFGVGGGSDSGVQVQVPPPVQAPPPVALGGFDPRVVELVTAYMGMGFTAAVASALAEQEAKEEAAGVPVALRKAPRPYQAAPDIGQAQTVTEPEKVVTKNGRAG